MAVREPHSFGDIYSENAVERVETCCNDTLLPSTKNGNLDVSENSGTPKSSILIGVSIINHRFWGTPIFGNTHLEMGIYSDCIYSDKSIFARRSGYKGQLLQKSEQKNWGLMPIPGSSIVGCQMDGTWGLSTWYHFSLWKCKMLVKILIH